MEDQLKFWEALKAIDEGKKVEVKHLTDDVWFDFGPANLRVTGDWLEHNFRFRPEVIEFECEWEIDREGTVYPAIENEIALKIVCKRTRVRIEVL